MKKYSLGLDIGTNSVGWALVDEDNQLVKKNNFTFWGVRLFDEAQTASKRRINRSSRRRIARRRKRIELLQTEFFDEINKVDPNFFQRLNDSFLKREDKQLQNRYTYFDDYITDKQYFQQFPTIYHLRKHLLETNEKVDIRMLYLAIHHMIKYRGHFLNNADTFNVEDNKRIEELFKNFNDALRELRKEDIDNENYYSFINNDQIDGNFIDEFSARYNSISTKNDLKNELMKLFGVSKNSLVNEFIITLIVSKTVKVNKLSLVKNLKYENTEIDLNSENLDDQINDANHKISELGIIYSQIEGIKEIVDTLYIRKLLGSHKYLSDAMVFQFEEHKSQLKEFKHFVKKYIPNKYNEVFRKAPSLISKDNDETKDVCNYPFYIGMNSSRYSDNKINRFKHCDKEEFYAYVKKLISSINTPEAQEEKDRILSLIEQGNFLLRQNSGQNTYIPMQLNLQELNLILEKQSKFYSFLNDKKGDLTVKERILTIFKYHVPYYIGPLGEKAKNSWLVKNDDHKNDYITPYNFEEVVNKDKTAERFIQRMQNKCTYLHGCYCLPKNSIIFSEYNCLSYLNKLSINGSLIDRQLKKEIFENVFLKNTKPTKKSIINYLKESNYEEDASLSIPEVNCDMSSYCHFKKIFGNQFDSLKDEGIIEEIIKDIVIFEDKNILEKRLYEIYDLPKEIVKQIKQLNFKGYSSLSKKLLCEIRPINKETGEISKSILEIMRETNYNLQEILWNQDFGFMECIDENNKTSEQDTVTNYKTFIDENLYVSPGMKRALIQSYSIIEEIERILKQPIDKYYIECNRSNKAIKEQTKSRTNHTLELYQKCVNDAKNIKNYDININNLNKTLNNIDKNSTKTLSDKLYLYFTQLGKCLYTMENIDISNLNNYDIDHIYPQSIIKDDSLRNNRVLVKKDFNQNRKKDLFLFEIPNYDNTKLVPFYKMLLDKELITKEKYRRLTQKEFNNQELEGFVNRQIITTNQAVKGLIELLKMFKNVDKKNIIYSKAEVISDFRQKYDFDKSRDANNYHHAHDAYLNVVIGRAINEYYKAVGFSSGKDLKYIKAKALTINPDKILEKNRTIKNRVIWDKDATLKILNKNIKTRFDINETVMTLTGNDMFKKVSISSAGKGTVNAKAYLPLEKYGGIKSFSYCVYCLLKIKNKKNKVEYVLEAIPGAFKKKVNLYLDKYTNYGGNYEIVKSLIPINCLIYDGNLKYRIASKSNDAYNLLNATDRNFKYYYIKTIKKISKYKSNQNLGIKMNENQDFISVAENNKGSYSIKLDMYEIDDLFEEIIKKYNSKCFSYSPSQKINDNKELFYKKSISEKINIIFELLKLYKTNTRMAINLKEMNLSQNFGVLKTNKKLHSGMKFIAESITGYYKYIIFEVPDSGV